MRLIEAGDIQHWAETRPDAMHRMPELIRRLINATTDDLVRRDLSAGKGVYSSGFDGIVRRSEKLGNEFVPPTQSVWEIGVGKDPKGKAEEDYAKRVKDPLGLDPKETRFVFVTPRVWPGRVAWESEKAKLADWADVRVIDADVLEQWIETAVSAESWLAELLNKPTRVFSLEKWAKEWLAETTPPLPAAVLRAGRDDAEQAIGDWLGRPSEAIAVPTDDAGEAAAFLYAVLTRRPSERHAARLDRTVVVRDEETLRRLGDEKHRLIIVALGCTIEAARRVAAKGHHVICAVPRDGVRRDAQVELGLLDRAKVTAWLEKSELTPVKAEQVSRVSNGHTTALRRLLGAGRRPLSPELVPLLLVGGWDPSNQADVATVCALLAKSPSELEDLVRRQSTGPDAPLRRIASDRGEVVMWASRPDAWLSVASQLSHRDLTLFETTIVDVLPTDDRVTGFDESGGIVTRGKPRSHSDLLRSGLAETLILLAIDDQREDGQTTANHLVGQVLARLDSTLSWDSNWSLYATLAEASPDSFLARMRKMLRDEPELARWLVGPIAGKPNRRRSKVVQLLWAVAMLAWSPTHLSDAAEVLTQIAALEPKLLREGPTAQDLLSEIFLPWSPSTTAKAANRNAVLKRLIKRFTDTAYPLVLGLLRRSTAHSLPKPVHRRWLDGSPERPSGPEHYSALVTLWDLALAGPGDDPNRWLLLAEHLDDLSYDKHRIEAVRQLALLDPQLLELGVRRKLLSVLRDLAQRHREFSDRDWAMESSLLDQIDAAAARLEPTNPDDRAALLFGRDAHAGRGYGEQQNAQLGDDRVEALRSLVARSDVSAFQQFVLRDDVTDHVDIGWRLVLAEPGEAYLRELTRTSATSDDPRLVRLLSGIVWSSANKHPADWDQKLALEVLDVDIRVAVLLSKPNVARRDALLNRWGDEAVQLFWRRVDWRRLVEPTSSQAFIASLIAAGRPRDALSAAARLVSLRADSIEPRLVLHLLGQPIDSEDTEDDTMRSYGVKQLLDIASRALQGQPAKMRELELAWYPLVDEHSRAPRAVHAALEADPRFFAELVHRSFVGAEPASSTAWRVLREWSGMPARNADAVDEVALNAWIREARERMRELDPRLVPPLDEAIGTVLVRSPRGADGEWPHEAVRDVLEGIEKPESLEGGFVVGHFNRGGATFFDPNAGGDGERATAKAYRESADRLSPTWPATARLLKRIADNYHREARSSDRMARAFEDSYGHTPHAEERLEVYIDEQEAAGRYVVVLQDVLETSDYALQTWREAARKLSDRKGRLARAEEDVYIIVPQDYRSLGAPPPSWYIDAWMAHAKSDYYVGLLSAAAIHGASHQQSQTFYVMVTKVREPVTIGKARIVFVVGDLAGRLVKVVETDAGTMRISTPETTMLDLIAHGDAVGGIDIVATVAVELAENVVASQLAVVASAYEPAVAQRLGWLLEDLGLSELANELFATLPANSAPVAFEAGVTPDAPDTNRWQVFGTRHIEVDL